MKKYLVLAFVTVCCLFTISLEVIFYLKANPQIVTKTVTVYQPIRQTIEIFTPRGSVIYNPCQKEIFVEFSDSMKRERYTFMSLVDNVKLVLGKNSEVYAQGDAVEGIILESGEEFGCKYVSRIIEK